MKLHFHKFKKFEWGGYTERGFLGETIKEFKVFQRFRICEKCGKAQEYLAAWHDLNEEGRKVLVKKIETGEVKEIKN